MLSLSNGGMSAGHAGKYFAQEDYYLRGGESSRWLGKGSETLKLQGQVQEKEFRNLAQGKSPDGGKQLVAPKITRDGDGHQLQSHRAGNDLTFSAPKSVSVGYAAGNGELKEIWDRAVINTMRHVEEHYSQYRSPDGVQTSGNVVAAKFDHVTSRSLDPEVHSHVFLVNMTRAPEGGWRANEPKNIYADKISIGMLARQEAMHLYEKAGYQTYFTDRKQMLFEIKGVRQEELESFSKRSAEIAEQVAQWKAEGRFPGLPNNLLKQMAALDTRDPKRKVTREDVRREWDRGFQAAGSSADQVKERIEASRIDRHLQGEEPAVVLAETTGPAKTAGKIMKQASAFLTDREAVFDRAELIKTAARISGGRHDLEELNAAIDGRVGGKIGIERMGQEAHGWQAGKEFYSTKEMRELEARNVETLKSLGEFESVTSRPEVEAYLAGLAKESTLSAEQACHPDAYRAGLAGGDRLALSEGQRRHIVNELAGDKGFSVTQGDPGTGKTFAAEIVERFNRDVLAPTGRNHYTLNVAYTGKAALEMSKANGKPAYTIDGFLNRFHDGKIGEDILGQIAPDLSAGEAAKVQVAIKVDEASFVGGRQAEHLLQALNEIKLQGVEVKLVETGDRKQMQSIQASPFFVQAAELAKQGHGDYAAMKEINRQKNRELLKAARTLNRDGDRQRLGANAKETLAMLKDQGRVTEIPDRRELVKAAVAHYLAESSKPSPDPAKAAAGGRNSVLLVTPLNHDRQELNDEIRMARLAAGEIEKGRSFEVLTQVHQDVTTAGFRPGMILVFSGERDKAGKAKPMRGTRLDQQGEIQSVDPEKNSVTVLFGKPEAEREVGVGEGEKIPPEEGAPKTAVKSFDAAELVGKTALYRRDRREFSPGERILFGKNTKDQSVWSPEGKKQAGIRNGETGEIVNLSVYGKDTVAQVRLDDGRKMNVHLDRFGPQQIDYGYAVTVYKGQGGTVDSVIPFHYVKPGVENDRSALASIAGVAFTEARFRQWNAALSDFERTYRTTVKIGGHGGDLGFAMLRDKESGAEHKGVAIQFHNGKAIVADEELRVRMRDSGMYWSPDLGSWVASATNESAVRLMDRHPLKDAAYVRQLKELAAGELAAFKPVRERATGERNFQTEVDSTLDAEKFGRASYNVFNVAITRARHEAMVFTNSVTGLEKAVQSVDEKTTTIGRDLSLKIEGLTREARSHTEHAAASDSRGLRHEIPEIMIVQARERTPHKNPVEATERAAAIILPKPLPGHEMER